jgi:hypothetical protein
MLPAYSSERTDDFLIVRDHVMQAFYKRLGFFLDRYRWSGDFDPLSGHALN